MATMEDYGSNIREDDVTIGIDNAIATSTSIQLEEIRDILAKLSSNTGS
jgi:hypothetical protein